MQRVHAKRSWSRSAAAGLLLATAYVSPAGATTLAGPVVHPGNGHIYYLLDTATWTASEAEAIDLGGHLVTVNDAAENDWLFDNIVPLLPTEVYSTIWLGLNDAALEGTFVWASGEAVVFTNWSPDQPDDARSEEDYAHMWTPSVVAPSVWRQWNDFPDSGLGFTYGVVEIVPEPATGSLVGAGLIALLWSRRRRGADRR